MPGICPVGQEVEMEDNYREVKKAEPCLKLIHMDQVEVEEIEWLFYPFIPYGKVTIIQGDPGEGKTTVVLQIIAKLTKGEAILSETSEGKSEETGVEPINVIYQTAEDGLGDTIKPRLLAAGADCSRVLVIDDQDQPLTMVDERLEEAIIQTKERIVELDPIQGFQQAALARTDFSDHIHEFSIVECKGCPVKDHILFTADIYFIQFEQGCLFHCYYPLCLLFNSRARSSMRSPLLVNNTIRW